MFRCRNLAPFIMGLVLVANSPAGFADAEFSAEMVQVTPQGETVGKMHIGNNRMRMEMQQAGKQVIHIADSARQISWLIYPDQQSYMEQRGGKPGAVPGQMGGKPSNPCAGIPGASCKKLGIEDISGRPAEKWQITFAQKDETSSGMQWIDVERGVPLRQQFPNGQSMELKFVGMENLAGRSVEKWEMLSSRGKDKGAPQRSVQWYDPKLKMAIRQEFPGGYVSEIRNIKEGKQPESLFAVPAGYKLIKMPQGSDAPARR